VVRTIGAEQTGMPPRLARITVHGVRGTNRRARLFARPPSLDGRLQTPGATHTAQQATAARGNGHTGGRVPSRSATQLAGTGTHDSTSAGLRPCTPTGLWQISIDAPSVSGYVPSRDSNRSQSRRSVRAVMRTAQLAQVQSVSSSLLSRPPDSAFSGAGI
jgi:hypothetical protein